MKIAVIAIVVVAMATTLEAAGKNRGKDVKTDGDVNNGNETKFCFKQCGMCLQMIKGKLHGMVKGSIVYRVRDENVMKGVIMSPIKVTYEKGTNKKEITLDSVKGNLKPTPTISDECFLSEGEDKICGKCISYEVFLQTGNPATDPKLKMKACLIPEGGVIDVEKEKLSIDSCALKTNIELMNIDASKFDDIVVTLATKPLLKKVDGKDQYVREPKAIKDEPCKNKAGVACTTNKLFKIDDDGTQLFCSTKTQYKVDSEAFKTGDVVVGDGEATDSDDGTGQPKKYTFVSFSFKRSPDTKTTGKFSFKYDPIFEGLGSSAGRVGVTSFFLVAMVSIIRLF